MLSILRMAALATLLLVSSCYPPEIGAERARDYFAEHRAEFDRIIEQVELCQIDSGRIDYESNFRCWSSEGASQGVQEAMRAANAQWIRAYYNEREGEERRLTSVSVAMPSSYGFSFAGVIESFVYEVTPAADAAYERIDYGDGAFTERVPVTDSPHHWFWEKISR